MARVDPGVKSIALGELVPSKRNPNRMEPERYELLKEAIRLRGFLQPILVTPRGGKYQIVDGHHRVKALIELGLPSAKAVVADLSDLEVEGLQLGMNRNRGEIDLSVAADVLNELRMAGWEVAQLQTTGFTADEIAAMTAPANSVLDDLDGAVSPPAENTDIPDKPFVLELQFATKDQLQRARKLLKKAAGKGGDLATGLFNAFGEV